MRRGPSHRAGQAFARGLILGRLVARGQLLTTAAIRTRFGVSRATAKRDLVQIRALWPMHRRGAAVARLRKHQGAIA